MKQRCSLAMLRHLLARAFVFFSISIVASAASPEVRPGEYVRDRDTGWLTIQRDEQNLLTFAIESIGGNCHSCGVSGVIQGNTGQADAWDGGESRCIISFSAERSGVGVDPTTQQECLTYCGARASFEGLYALPPTACTRANRQGQRDRFLTLYRSRHYAKAASTLQTLIGKCSKFMSWIEIDQVRNDLALSQFRNGEVSQCLETLNATRAAKVKSEEELQAGAHFLPPCDFTNYIEVARATWFNKELCLKAKSRRR